MHRSLEGASVKTAWLMSAVFSLIVTVSCCKAAHALNLTTVCRFNSGPRAGTSFDFQPYGVQPIPVGAPCTDGQGSNGVAVASSGSGDLPSQGAVPLTTVCRFNSGPRAGTFFDFRPYGVRPIPVNAPCTDGQGSNGVAVASSGSGGGGGAGGGGNQGVWGGSGGLLSPGSPPSLGIEPSSPLGKSPCFMFPSLC